MRTFTKFLMASAAAASLVAFAPAASAAIVINAWTVDPDGEITVTFNDTQISDANSSGSQNGTNFTHSYNSGTGAFDDTFDFFLPTGMVMNASVSTANLTFSSISFNGVSGTVFNSPGFHTGHVAALPVTAGGLQHLDVSGTGIAAAGWSGTASFVPVPEPATWGLMIMGFGGVGALLRNRRRQATFA